MPTPINFRWSLLRVAVCLGTWLVSACVTSSGVVDASDRAGDRGAYATTDARSNRQDELRRIGLFDRVIARTLDPQQGGSTTDLATGQTIEIGQRFVAVSLAGGEAIPANTPPAELRNELAQFVARQPTLERPNHYLGTWLDHDNGLIYLDVSLLIAYASDRERPAALAEANRLGVTNRQTSIFDLGSGKTYRVDARRCRNATRCADLEELLNWSP